MRSLSAPILVKHPTHSPYPVPGAPPMYAFHYVSLLYGFKPCTTPHIPFSSLPAPRKSFLNLNLEYLPVCFSSSSLKPTALPHINQIGATGLIHLSMGAPIPSKDSRLLLWATPGPNSRWAPHPQNLQITCTGSPCGGYQVMGQM